MIPKVRAFSALAAGALLLASCQSARVLDTEANRLFQSGDYDGAAAHLRKGYESQGKGGRDSLLYILDLGLALHQAGKFEESNRAFLEADQLAEIKDYTSLSVEAATFLTSQNITDYKGEEFENVMISTYLAMNYALLGNREDALVEAKRVNRKLERLVTEGGRGYRQNAFAQYLSGLLYESEGNWNSAYIDYKRTFELAPDAPGLGPALWRVARKGGFAEDLSRWKEAFRLTPEQTREPEAELIVIYQNGISPVKHSNPDFRSLPRFYPRPNPVLRAQVEVDGQLQSGTTSLYDIEKVAIQNLEEKYGALVAKKLAGLVAKEVVADQIERRTQSPLAGFLARVAMYASDQADCRSWNLLPRDLQMARIPVRPGTHVVRALPVGAAALAEKTVSVAAGQKVFVSFRYMP